jgi:hypothetical protein
MWVTILVSALISIGVAIAAYAMMPGAPKPKPASLTDVSAPTANQGLPIPVVFGTVRVMSPNVVWWGDLHYEPIKTYVL